MKVFVIKIELFPPGHYLLSDSSELIKWYKPDWISHDSVKNSETSIKAIHDSLSAAVKRQLMSDVPYGVLLSGGLDSSITSALAKNLLLKELNLMISKMPGILNFIHFLLD